MQAAEVTGPAMQAGQLFTRRQFVQQVWVGLGWGYDLLGSGRHPHR